MGTVPFNFDQFLTSPSGAGMNQFGQLPWAENPIGGSNNGLSLSGAWASGGFGGATPTSGFNAFSGTVPFSSGSGASGGSFGLPGSSFPAFQGPSLTSTIPGNFGSSFLPQVTGKDLSKIYGKGVGGALASFLNSGAGFNPQVMQAQVNAAMPLLARGEAKLQDMYGNMGSAYSSTAAIGIGDFESQFSAALEGQFAQEYQQSVQNYLNVLMGVAPDARDNKAQGSNWLSTIGGIAEAILPIFGI